MIKPVDPAIDYYHGLSTPGGAAVYVVRAGREQPLPSVGPHGPGLGWGYLGSGPAQCALSILTDALGGAVCGTCGGSGQVRYQDGRDEPVPAGRGDADESVLFCTDCDDGRIGLPYQQFKEQFVSVWPIDGEWTMTVRDVLAWLQGYGLTPPAVTR